MRFVEAKSTFFIYALIIFGRFFIDFATPSRTESLFLVFQGYRFLTDVESIFGSIFDHGFLIRATPIEENGLFWFSNGIDLLIDRSKVNPKIYQQIDTTEKPKKANCFDRGCSEQDSAIQILSKNQPKTKLSNVNQKSFENLPKIH